MGQCSTLPTEARNDPSFNPASDHSSSRYRAVNKDHMATEISSDNSGTHVSAGRQSSKRSSGYNLHVQTVHNVPGMDHHHASPHYPSPHSSKANAHFQPSPFMPPTQQERQTSISSAQPMQEERDMPLPPEGAVRMRCYKLNLESEYVGIYSMSTPRYEGQIFGPFLDLPPPLTYSASDDSSTKSNPTSVVIQTAQIFRGITVAKDGTILTQNARATRSNRGNKMKMGEKSRQAAKIDKANDLVEESIAAGKMDDGTEAQMVSLVIVGEYDEMKQLVRDGSKKLREANGLPDDVLLAGNHPRGTGPTFSSPLLSPSRKRVSPFGLGNPHSLTSPKSPTSKPRHTPHSAPPKLKGHPRDHPSRRSMDDRQLPRRGFSPMNDPCNHFLHHGFNSIWNCGGNEGSGTMSPTQNVLENKGYSSPTSPPPSRRPLFEGRNENNYRAGRVSERMEPPGHHHNIVHA